MELIYLWVEKFHNINQKGFSFSNNFDITFIDYKLKINKRESPSMNVYPKHISNITALIGKNGAGKSSIIELLGEKEQNRKRNSNDEDSWFSVYWIKDKFFVIEEMFQVTEQVWNSLIRNFTDDRDIFKYMHNPSSLYCEYHFETQQLEFKKYLQSVKKNFEYAIQFYMPRTYGQNYNTESLRRDHYTSQYIRHIFFERDLGLYRKYVFLIKNRNENNNNESSCDLNYSSVKLKISIASPDFAKVQEYKIDDKIKRLDNFIFVFGERIAVAETTKSLIHSISNSPDKKLSLMNQCLISFITELIKNFSIEFNDGNIPDIDIDIAQDKDYGTYLLNLLYAVNNEVEGNINNDFGNTFIIAEVLKKVFNLILSLPRESFSADSINIPITKNGPNEQIVEFLNYLDDINSHQHYCSAIGYFSFVWEPLSNGEKQFLHLTSSIFAAVQKFRFGGLKHAILLLDEPDNNMHPETARQFIFYIISELKRYHKITFQIIIASHSPLLLSDIPSHSVILMEKDLQDGNCVIRESHLESFAANIHTLLANDFFMTSTIGAWAEYYIKSILMDIEGLASQSDIKEYSELKHKIALIGEDIIRYQLEQKLSMALKNSNFTKQQKIDILKKELAELEQQND